MNTPEHPNPETTLGQAYGDDYLSWKRWGEADFAAVRPTDAAYYAAELRRTRRAFPAHSRVLEIGFGSGHFLRYAREQGWDVCGTEVNKALVDIAQEKGFQARHADSLSDFEPHSQDLIVAFDVLEHIDQAHLPALLSTVRSLLKPDGVFLARFPNGDSPFGLANQHGDLTHVTTLGSWKARYLANKAQLDVRFLGGEAMPLWGSGPARFVHRLLTQPIKKALDLLVRWVFLPSSQVVFSSANLTMVCAVGRGTQEA